MHLGCGARRREELGERAPEVAEDLVSVGVQLGDRGQYAGEIEMYRKALSIKHDFGNAWANLGVALASSGERRSPHKPRAPRGGARANAEL